MKDEYKVRKDEIIQVSIYSGENQPYTFRCLYDPTEMDEVEIRYMEYGNSGTLSFGIENLERLMGTLTQFKRELEKAHKLENKE